LTSASSTDNIPLHIKRLCGIERMHGNSEGLNSFAKRLLELDRRLPDNDFPSSNGAS